MKANGYTIIYLWKNERHRHGVFYTLEAAQAELALFIQSGWKAWIEEL